MRLKDKVAIITGGAKGIGRATCLLFAREGCRVLVADIDGPGAVMVAKEITDAGGVADSITTDVADEEQAKNMVSRAVKLWQQIDILVNNAVSFRHRRVEDATREDWDKVLSVGVMGTSFCSKYAVAVMKKQGYGSIVNVGSINAIVAMPDWMTYNATKAAIVNMSRSMALDLGPFQIRVNCVCPGITRTPALEAAVAELKMSVEDAEKVFAPRCIIKRFARAEEIAPAILFVASDEASYMTGATVMVDGGFTS